MVVNRTNIVVKIRNVFLKHGVVIPMMIVAMDQMNKTAEHHHLVHYVNIINSHAIPEINAFQKVITVI